MTTLLIIAIVALLLLGAITLDSVLWIAVVVALVVLAASFIRWGGK